MGSHTKALTATPKLGHLCLRVGGNEAIGVVVLLPAVQLHAPLQAKDQSSDSLRLVRTSSRHTQSPNAANRCKHACPLILGPSVAQQQADQLQQAAASHSQPHQPALGRPSRSPRCSLSVLGQSPPPQQHMLSQGGRRGGRKFFCLALGRGRICHPIPSLRTAKSPRASLCHARRRECSPCLAGCHEHAR